MVRWVSGCQCWSIISERKQHETVDRHGSGVSSSSSPIPQDPSTNHLTPNQWKKFPESWLFAGEREHESAHQEETSSLPRRIKPQDCSVIAVGTDIGFPLIPVKLKDLPAQESIGTVSMSSPFPHAQGLPLSRRVDYGAPSPPSAHEQGYPKPSCWELYLLFNNAESWDIFWNFHARRTRLSFKIMCSNTKYLAPTCRKHGCYWFRAAQQGNGRLLLPSSCWYFLLNDLAEQIKKAKAITVFCCHPNDPKCSEKIATKHFTQSICGTGLKSYDSKKITEINEHFPQASVPLENLQVLMCTKFEKYNFNSILKTT